MSSNASSLPTKMTYQRSSRSSRSNNVALQRSQYSLQCIRTFNVVATYIVNTYYNHLYAAAVKMKNQGRAVSITDAYRQVACNYYIMVRGDDYCKSKFHDLLSELRDYFEKSGYSALSIQGCIDIIVLNFVPTDYHKYVTNEQKLKVIKRVLLSILADFGNEAVGPMFLTVIIDKRASGRANAGKLAMREKIIDLLIISRNDEFQRHLDVKMNHTSNGDKRAVIQLQGQLRTVRKKLWKADEQVKAATRAFQQKRNLALQLVDLLKISQQKCAALQRQNTELLSTADDLQHRSMVYAPSLSDEPMYNEITAISDLNSDPVIAVHEVVSVAPVADLQEHVNLLATFPVLSDDENEVSAELGAEFGAEFGESPLTAAEPEQQSINELASMWDEM